MILKDNSDYIAWNEAKNDFRRIVKEYDGEITEFPQSIDITIKNDNTEYSVYAQLLCVGVVLGATKKTGSKSTGTVNWSFSEDQLVCLLEEYGFKKKNTEQLSMFDI